MTKLFNKIKVGIGLAALAVLFAFNLHHAVVYHYGVLNLNFSQHPQVLAQTNSAGDPYCDCGGGSPGPPICICGGGSSISWQDFVRLTCVYAPNTWGIRRNRMSICTSPRVHVGNNNWTSATCAMREEFYPQTLNTVCHRRN